MGLGRKLKYILKRKGKTLRWLAEETGISVNTLYSITRRDTVRVNIDTLQKISECLEISVTELIENNFVSTKELYEELEQMISSKKWMKELSDDEKETAFSIFKEKGEERADEYLECVRVKQRWEYTNSEEFHSRSQYTNDLLNAFSKLNNKGKHEAIKRILELSELSEYKKISSEEGE